VPLPDFLVFAVSPEDLKRALSLYRLRRLASVVLFMARLCATLHPKPRQTHHSCYAMPARRPLSLSKPGFSLCPCPKRCLCRCLSCCNLEGRLGRPPDKLRDKRSLFHPLCLPWCLLRASRPSSPCVRCHGGGGARVCFACLRRRLWAPLAAGGFVGARWLFSATSTCSQGLRFSLTASSKLGMLVALVLRRPLRRRRTSSR
jgi:hypothetical protein